MQISISNVIQVARLIGQGTIIPIVKACLKMWLDFTKSDVIGEELVINGDFAVDEDWTTDTSTSIDTVNHLLVQDGTAGRAYQSVSFLEGNNTTVIVTFTVERLDSGSFQLDCYGLLGQVITTVEGIGTYSFQGKTTNSTNLYINNGGGFADGSISNVTVKEVSQFVKDKSPNTNDAKLFTGKALEFNGNDAVDIGDLSIMGDKLTLAFWVNPSNTLGWVFDSRKKATKRLVVGFNANTLSIYSYNDWISFGSLPLNKYSRVVVVIDGSNAKCYVDGTQLGFTITNLNDIALDGSATAIGSSYTLNSSFFTGSLSDFQIYNEAWTTSDVTFDYNNPNHLVTDNPNTTIALSNLKGYWALSEGSGSIAYDSTGLGAELVTNGDFEGTDWWSIGTYWAVIGNGLATRTVVGSQTNYSLSKSGVFVIGTSYTIRVVINAITSGNVKVRIGATDSPEYISEGTYVFTGVCSSNDVLRISPSDDFNGSISNISVKEVKADDGDILGATWVDQQPTIPQLGMQDWSKGSNLYLFSEPIANEGAASGATYESFTWGNTSGANFTNCTRFGDNSVDRYRYGATVPSSVDATLSFYIIMDDLSEPNIGINSVSGDFSMVIGGTVGTTLSTTSTNVGGNVWRVSKTADTTTTNLPNNGIVKYTTQSAKGFRVVGWQIEESLIPNSYIGTNGSAASNATLVQNPNNVGFDVLGNRLRLREGGFNLDGSGYGEVDMSSDLTAITNGSIQFWMKNTKTTSFVLFNETSTTNYLGAWNGSGDFYNDSASGTVTQYADDNSTVTSTKITDGDWHFYTFTGIDLSLFDKFQISNYSNSSSIWLDCIIDDVIIYCDVLTPEEISFNYNYFLPFKRANVAFKARVLADGGTFEAESCLIETIDNLA